MGELGKIKELTLSGGEITCVVDIANGGEKTATIYGLAGVDTYPLPGDEVKIDYNGGQWVVSAVFRDAGAGAGETIIYSRNSDGNVVSSVHCKADGSIRAENDNGFFELKSNGQFNANDNFTVD